MSEMNNSNDFKEKLNLLVGNVINFTDDDMLLFDTALVETSENQNFTMSYMSIIFYSQFIIEIYVGSLVSKKMRTLILNDLEDEVKYKSGERPYWHDDMKVNHMGRTDLSEEKLQKDLNQILNVAEQAYVRMAALNDWYATDEGKEKLDEYCLTNRAIKEVKLILLQLPYLMRRFDRDKNFAALMSKMVSEVALGIGRNPEEEK